MQAICYVFKKTNPKMTSQTQIKTIKQFFIQTHTSEEKNYYGLKVASILKVVYPVTLWAINKYNDFMVRTDVQSTLIDLAE